MSTVAKRRRGPTKPGGEAPFTRRTESVEERVINAATPPAIHLVTSRTPQKIIATRWKAVGDDVPAGYRDRWLYVAEIAGDGTGRDPTMERAAGDYPAVSPLWGIFADNPEWHSRRRIHEKMERMLTFHFPAGWPSFEAAQIALNGYAWEKRWTPDPPLPVDDDEPKPVRANGNHEGHNEAAKTQDPGVAPGPGEAWHAVVPIDLVDANPWQPRRDFGEAELEELKAMIAVQGLLNPPVARKVGARYQLAAGERRWRACQSLGWLTITLSVRTLTDAEMRQVAFQENKGRKDLSPIERARELRSMLDAGDASGVCDLAQKLGMTEPPVSELLRLLELPETFQRRLISQEITQTQARCLLPYRALAGIMDAIDKDLGKEPFTGNTEAFAELVQDAIWEATERMKGEKWTGIDALHFHGNVPIFEPTPEQREQLGVIEVDCRWRAKEQRGKPELRATNKKLWKKLQEAHAKKWIAEQAKENGHGKKVQAGKGGAKRPDRPPTEKEKQALAKHEAGRRAEQLRLTRRKIWGWRIDRLRQAAAEALVSAEADRQERIAVYLIVASEAWELDGSAVRRHADDRENALNAALRSCGAKQAGKHPWGAILDCKQVGALWIKTCAEILWGSDHGPECKIPDEAVVSIAEHLEVELAQLWRADQKSGLGRAFFALHTREQLLDLGKELGVPLFEKQDKAAMVRVLSTAAKNLKLPKELAKAKKP